MLNFSSDLLNIIGTNEIESFNKTLNEMLVVWNTTEGQQSQQSQTQQPTSTSAFPQLDANISSIMSNTGSSSSYLQIPIPTPQLTNSNQGLGSSKMNNRSFLTSSQQLDSFFFENQSLFSSHLDDKMDQSGNNDEVTKVLNEINRQNKEFQPIEIIPLKNTKFGEYEAPKSFNEFGQLSMNAFQIDSAKLEELRNNPSVLDPLFTLPYNTSNPTYVPNNAITSTSTSSTSAIIAAINNSNNNSNSNISVKQESQTANVGPMRHTPFDQPKEKEVHQPTLVSLSKDQLSTFSTTEMEEYEKVNNNIRELTSQEKKDLKRQKRLIKNRESAHLSRQRKRERLTELEHRVEELTHNSSSLNRTLTGLESENLVLKAEVNQLIDVIRDSPVLTALFYSVVKNESATVY